jgi:predicted AAA+ superfamily ATPase
MLRRVALDVVRARLGPNPIVAILGARQVGKTTLARQVAGSWAGPVTWFDLEDPRDRARFADPGLALRPLTGLVVIDEIQRQPDLFPLLRVLADRPGRPASFLILGSAAPELLRQGSESLAGRLALVRLEGLALTELPPSSLDQRWVRGGFPRSLLADHDAESQAWREDFIETFLERDLPQLGIDVAAPTMRRFFTMLAHSHGAPLNASALGRSLGVADTTVRRYVDHLEATYVVRVLPSWHVNVRKRQVKAPKVFIADTGLLHTLLGLGTRADVERHPVLGASWEGFAIEQIAARLGWNWRRFGFWATHGGAELDLLVDGRLGFEVKRTEAPRVTPSMRSALEALPLDELIVVHGGPAAFPLAERVRAVPLADLSSLDAYRSLGGPGATGAELD